MVSKNTQKVSFKKTWRQFSFCFYFKYMIFFTWDIFFHLKLKILKSIQILLIEILKEQKETYVQPMVWLIVS